MNAFRGTRIVTPADSWTPVIEMQSLSGELRNQLAAAVKAARRAGEAGARSALAVLAVGDARAHPSLSPDEQDLRRRLRAHGRQLGDRLDAETGVQQVERLAHEVAYEHWHRMLFARFLAENDLLIEPDSGVAVSLTDCEELARERGQDCWTVAGRFAERMLPRIFRSDDPALAVPLAPETRQTLERLLESLPPAVFAARDSLGWTYQFWQAERKEAVNKSGVKIGADELPAVTQLFTERYMVLFLLHNTVGAWRAGRVLAAQPELAATAASEDELRRAVRLEAAGGYDFSYLRFVREPREDDEEEQPTGPWRPAAGTFAGWPGSAADLRVLDPCCGSGHFLVECLDLLARLRMDEERLAPGTAVEAVLRDNLCGLEIDPRCTQIAAFNLALAAWTWPGTGGHRPLPALNLACSGLAPNATRDDWIAMAEAAADAGGLPAKRDLLGVDDSLMSAPLRNSLGALHDLFAQAPVLGSLIDPRAVQADLFQHDYESTRALLGALLDREGGNDEQTERAVVAHGMARAAELLAGRYHLVITNVPYLGRRRQVFALKKFAQGLHPLARANLATLFVSRTFRWLHAHGTQAVVTPQEWLFLISYRDLREQLLKRRTWNLIARLGEHSFQDSQAAGAFATMAVISAGDPQPDGVLADVDVSAAYGLTVPTDRKARMLGSARIRLTPQSQQLENPDLVVAPRMRSRPNASSSDSEPALATCARLSAVADSSWGVSPADLGRLGRFFFEFPKIREPWTEWQSSVSSTRPYGGRARLLDLGAGFRELVATGSALFRGVEFWKRDSVVVTAMRGMPATIGTGEPVDTNVATVVPKHRNLLPAIWAYCESGEFSENVRHICAGLKVTSGTLLHVPFDAQRWNTVAQREYPNGLPDPHSDDPTQWIFHGHPCGRVVWDEEAKRTRDASGRIDGSVLQVAVARLVGYRWPAEHGRVMRLAEEARAWVARSGDLGELTDGDGIVCLASVGGDTGAGDRLRQLLGRAYGPDWSFATERALLAAVAADGRPAESIEAWLRDRFFEEHCRFFHQRPFVWHIWDGRRDGFHALVNYHRLAGSDGEGRRTLEALTFRYLGEWIARQQADRERGVDGADGRLAAAQDMQNQLSRIMTGDPPCDLFVRWKPLEEQAIGWEPDLNDGVRVNIRPFMAAELMQGGRAGAGVLRVKPKIGWNKDRGREALTARKRGRQAGPEEDADREAGAEADRELRPRDDYPWFWGCPGDGGLAERTDFPGGPDFDGNRWNDLHYTNAVKRAARSRKAREVGP